METNISINLSRYLQSPKSPETRAFFEGARSMITALQLAPSSEYATMLSTSNQQHIIALLVQSCDQQRARRRKDAQQMLKLYDVDKMSFLAFVFDLPDINTEGRAIDKDGFVLEDAMFRLLPGKSHDGWPDRKIEHDQTEQEITRDEYMALSDYEQQEYSYRRYFYLTLNGKPAFRICSSDTYVMEELIHQSILIGDPDINRRYLTEIYSSAEDEEVGRLYAYRGIIISALSELNENSHQASIAPMLTGQANCGYIKSAGQLLIAQIQWLLTVAKPDDLLKSNPSDIRAWAKVIQACHTGNDTDLAKFVTDKDIEGYQNPNGDPLAGVIPSKNGEKVVWEPVLPYEATASMQKDFFKHVLVNTRLRTRLVNMLDRVMNGDDLRTIDANLGVATALQELMEVLPPMKNALLDQAAANLCRP